MLKPGITFAPVAAKDLATDQMTEVDIYFFKCSWLGGEGVAFDDISTRSNDLEAKIVNLPEVTGIESDRGMDN